MKFSSPRGSIFILFVLLCFPFSSCVSLPESEEPSQEMTSAQPPSEADTSSYRIEVGDVLSINVWRVPLLTLDATVEADGTFLYPLLGKVPAEGKTLDQIREDLTKALAESYLVNPLVTISLSAKTQGFFVVGEVKTPGSFKIEEKIDVYQAIVIAGGFTDFASKKVKIIRKSGGRKRTIKINIGRFEKEKRVNPDAEIQPGDIVVVPKRLL